MTQDIDRLKLLFRRTGDLPPLSGTAVSLIRTIEDGDGSLVDVERIIRADPFICSNIFRIAALEYRPSSASKPTTLLAAISVVGLRSIRNLAIGLAVKQLSMSQGFPPQFDRELFSRHSYAAGIIAGYLFTRRFHLGLPVACTWSKDEIVAASMLHGLPIALLARSAPAEYHKILFLAQRMSLNPEQAFEKIYGTPIGELGSIAAEAWQLPKVFVDSLHYRSAPWNLPEEFDGLACIATADHLARQEFGYSDVAWHTLESLDPVVGEGNQLSADESQALAEMLRLAEDEYLSPFAQHR